MSLPNPCRVLNWFLGLGLMLALLAPVAEADDKGPAALPAPASRKVDFARDIRPIFERSCYECHGPKVQKSGFRLDLKASALAGGDSGPAIEPANSAESLLVEYVAGVDPDAIMPPKGKGDPLSP